MDGDEAQDSADAVACNEAISTIRHAMDELNTCLMQVQADELAQQVAIGSSALACSTNGSNLGVPLSPPPFQRQQPGTRSNTASDVAAMKANVLGCLTGLRTYLAQLLEQTQSIRSSSQNTSASSARCTGLVAVDRVDNSSRVGSVAGVDLSQLVQCMLTALGVESGGHGHASLAVLQEQLKKSETDRLKLRVEIEEVRAWRKVATFSEDDTKSYAVRLEVELARLRQSYLAAKADKKRLKGEKSDLLQQMKQLYATLQAKEEETREVMDAYELRLQDYELRLQDYEENLRQLDAEKETLEREKWDILMRARESSERSVGLLTQLDGKDSTIRMLEEEIARLQLANRSACLSPNGTRTLPSCVTHNGHCRITATESTPSPGGGISPARASLSSIPGAMGLSESLPSYCENWHDAERPASSASPANTSSSLRQSRRFAHRNSEPDLSNAEHKELRKSKRRRGFGSLSKVFSRSGRVSGKQYSDQRDDHSHSQVSLDGLSATYIDGGDNASEPSAHGLTDEQLQERHLILEEARGQPMARWRSSAVVAWLEVVLNMPQYARACMDNVKSGRLLLGMSDQEIELAFRMINPLHRRKLRLAIEEHRSPEAITVPKAREMDHVWVATLWMPQLGLGQHSDTVLNNLVDGRVLNSVSRREIDKLLGINRRFHQASMMYGIDLLRALHFDKQVLCDRRAMCEDADTDPLVWTNQRFIKWACSIDLAEYANNLQGSGVHGAIVVLEPSFGADAMATALGIPPSRTMIRRHLADELNSLIAPARSSLEVNSLSSEKPSRRGTKGAGSLGPSFIRSSAATDEKDVKRRRSFKDSLGRALGRLAKHDIDHHTHHQQHNRSSPHHQTIAITNSNSIGNISLAVSQSMVATLTMDLETTTV